MPWNLIEAAALRDAIEKSKKWSLSFLQVLTYDVLHPVLVTLAVGKVSNREHAYRVAKRTRELFPTQRRGNGIG